jgi:Ala-tRNA(Pro) deacylase
MAIAPRVETFLNEHGIAFELVPHKTTGSTHESAVAANVPDDRIAKAVLIRDDQGHAMAVVPGDARVVLDELNAEFGRNFGLDPEVQLERLFPDCAPGAAPPIGPAYEIPTFVDEALTNLPEVYFEAGDHGNLVRIAGPDFLRLLAGARRGSFVRRD